MSAKVPPRIVTVAATIMILLVGLSAANAFAQTLPGGTLDPATIPKYVTPW